MITVLVPIADGIEELEAVTLIDMLRRAGAEVFVASVMTTLQVQASRGVLLVADGFLDACSEQDWDLIAVPGGMPGADHLGQSAALLELVKTQLASGKWLAAICASPVVVLARNSLIEGKTATCYPSFQGELASLKSIVSEQTTLVDGNLITSQGPGTAMELSLTIIEALMGAEQRVVVAEAACARI